MALYYLTVKNITKDKQSAVASAAYRSGEPLYSERDNEVKSYGKREIKPDTFILAPKHAPEWVYDRERLWNEVEKVERNWNSRLAREVLVALPIELNNDQQKQLIMEFVKSNFVDHGMVADISIHRDKKHNPHAHIMLTVRPFNLDGTWGNKRVKNEEGKWVHSTNWNDKQTLLKWRKNFAEKVNEWYQKLGINERVSHESYEKQGLELLPKQRLTRKEYQIEKKAKEKALLEGKEYKPITYYGKLNQKIESYNKKLEVINQKIVSLSDYRNAVYNEQLAKLKDVQKVVPLSEDDIKAFKVVERRLNGYVDYHSAKQNLVKLSYWKRKIDREKRLLDAKAKVLAKAHEAYKKEQKHVLLYGFQPNLFNEQYHSMIQNYKKELNKYNQLVSVYNDIYDKSKRVFEIQRAVVLKEFNELYPKYADFYNDNDIVTSIKAGYVKLFKEHGVVRDSIHEFSGDTKRYGKDYVHLRSLLDKWNEVNKSLLILERTKEKYKKEYYHYYKNEYDSNKVFTASVNYTEARDQISAKENEKLTLAKEINNEMIKRYPDVSQDLIKQIPTSIQSKVLELHLIKEESGILSLDLKTVKDNMYQHTNFSNNTVDRMATVEHNVGNLVEVNNPSFNTGEVINALINMANQNEKEHDDLEKRRAWKKKQNKLYRDIGDNEL